MHYQTFDPPRPRCVHGYEPGECDTNTCPNWNFQARSDYAFDAEGRALKRRYAEQRGRNAPREAGAVATSLHADVGSSESGDNR